jgi:hypothetical protein
MGGSLGNSHSTAGLHRHTWGAAAAWPLAAQQAGKLSTIGFLGMFFGDWLREP